ncbi:hypothetical protein Tco_0940336 [Tanacetum coccineum]|uniref:Uncharacterized protein n=1 Tax=Tanacetum coccineum TaxID=301880 RepID=A0ABQ5DQD2_9ASTR
MRIQDGVAVPVRHILFIIIGRGWWWFTTVQKLPLESGCPPSRIPGSMIHINEVGSTSRARNESASFKRESHYPPNRSFKEFEANFRHRASGHRIVGYETEFERQEVWEAERPFGASIIRHEAIVSLLTPVDVHVKRFSRSLDVTPLRVSGYPLNSSLGLGLTWFCLLLNTAISLAVTYLSKIFSLTQDVCLKAGP